MPSDLLNTVAYFLTSNMERKKEGKPREPLENLETAKAALLRGQELRSGGSSLLSLGSAGKSWEQELVAETPVRVSLTGGLRDRLCLRKTPPVC